MDVTKKQAAEILGVSPKEILKMIGSGELKARKKTPSKFSDFIISLSDKPLKRIRAKPEIPEVRDVVEEVVEKELEKKKELEPEPEPVEPELEPVEPEAIELTKSVEPKPIEPVKPKPRFKSFKHQMKQLKREEEEHAQGKRRETNWWF